MVELQLKTEARRLSFIGGGGGGGGRGGGGDSKGYKTGSSKGYQMRRGTKKNDREKTRLRSHS